MSLIYLVYVSSAVHRLSEDELVEILRVSREHNQQLGVTGMLLYRSGSFIQALEGEEKMVNDLYEKICRDPRHHQIVKLISRPVEKRVFPEWSMGFQHMEHLSEKDRKGLSSFLDDPLTPESLSAQPTLAHRLLMSFRVSLDTAL